MIWFALVLLATSGGLLTLLVRHQRQFARQLADQRLALRGGVAHGLLEGRPLEVRSPPWGRCQARIPWRAAITLRKRDSVLDASVVGLRTGDAALDPLVVLDAEEPLSALLHLDAARRSDLVEVLTRVDVEIDDTHLVATGPQHHLPRLVAALRRVARTLDPDRPTPSLATRWTDEPDGAVRSRLLATALSTDARHAALALAEHDPDPRVHEVLAAELDDPDTLLELFLDASDDPLAERCFRRLKARDSEGLAADLVRVLLDPLATARARDRVRTRLGALRSRSVLPRLQAGWPDLPLPSQDQLAPVLLGVAAASATGHELATFVVMLLASSGDDDLWQEGLTALRRHGTLEHLAALPPPPPGVHDLFRRTRTVVEVQDAADTLARRYQLTISDRRVVGRVGGRAVTVLLEPPRVVVQVEGLPERIALVERVHLPRDTPFDDRFAPTGDTLVWSPRLRAMADRLASGHGLVVGPPRPGVLQWRGDHLGLELFEQTLDLARALSAAHGVAPHERIPELLWQEHHPEWLCRWLVAARQHALPVPNDCPWARHDEPRVRACFAAWEGAVDTLRDLFRETEDDDLRHFVADQLCAVGDEGLTALFGLDLDGALRRLADAPDEAAVAVLSTWRGNATVTAAQDDRILALTLAAPSPAAEPLWCRALRDGRGSGPPLLDAMQAHGGIESARALREVAARGTGVWSQHCRKAYQALSHRLGVTGGLSVADARGGKLSVADGGRGDLSEA